MTDYVKSTNFASKDSLATGNPLKIIKGTEFDTEFNNIATAVATKADSASPTFTGIPVAPTATTGTNTTQVATTAFVQATIPSPTAGNIYLASLFRAGGQTAVPQPSIEASSYGSSTYVLSLEAYLILRSGTIRTILKCNSAGGGYDPYVTGYAKVFINGVGVGTEYTRSVSGEPPVQTQDFTVNAGDVIQIGAKAPVYGVSQQMAIGLGSASQWAGVLVTTTRQPPLNTY
jgi:hypothetical protein